MRIRPFESTDIPRVADLHRRVFEIRARTSPALSDAYRRYLSDVFLNEQRREEGIGSLVHEEGDGDITGFLGVVARRMSMNGDRFVAAASTAFAVDPRSRSKLAGVRLLAAFFSGPQDVSVADHAGEASRRIWESLGGRVALLHSMQWVRPLRPCALFVSHVGRRVGVAGSVPGRGALARAVDSLAMRLPWSPLRLEEPAVHGEPMSAEAFTACFPALAGRTALRPEYDAARVRWALSRARQDRDCGDLEGILLRDDRGRPVGSYFHSMDPEGFAHVLHVAALPSAALVVTDHLFCRAALRGAIAIEGRLDARLLRALAGRQAIFHLRGPSVLVHAKRPELYGAFDRGDTFFSRLDGELCLRFKPGPVV